MAKPKVGSAQINVELAPELLDRVKSFAEARGQTLKHVVQRALVRHLDNPPPLAPEPPLPPGDPDPAPAAKPAKKPARRKK